MRTRDFLRNAVLASLYCAVYAFTYVSFLAVHYEYIGFRLFPVDSWLVASSFAFAVGPIFCYRGAQAVSSALATLVYLILYVPTILTFAFASGFGASELLLIQTTFFLGMCVLLIADSPNRLIPPIKPSVMNLMPPVAVLTILVTGYVLMIYWGNLGFPSFGEDLYLQRDANQPLGESRFTRYSTSWLSNVLVPLCCAYGIVTRRFWYVAIGTAASVILYMAAANKTMVLLPLFFIGLNALLRNRSRKTYELFTVALSIIAAIVLVADPDNISAFSSLFMFRIIGNSGQLTMAYYEFFSVYPQTAYTHVSGVSQLLGRAYPYGDLGLGQAVGQYYWSPLMNANASFWATDGLAAIGLLGVLLSSTLCAALFIAINWSSRGHDYVFGVLAFVPFLITLLNQSMFSAAWSGGGLLLILFCSFNRPVRSPQAAISRASATAARTLNVTGRPAAGRLYVRTVHTLSRRPLPMDVARPR